MLNAVGIEKLTPTPYKPLAQFSRSASADGCVLLKNEGSVLPISKENVVSLFGRTQIDYNKSGTGSGGLVWVEYSVNILDGLRNNPKITLNEELIQIYKDWIAENPFDEGPGWAQEPWCQKEMVPDESTVIAARAKSDVAVIIIGRTAGEDKDNKDEKGSWYVSEMSLLTPYETEYELPVWEEAEEETAEEIEEFLPETANPL